MLYLLGGAARSGKSTVARRFSTETGISFFCLDYLMMGFANGAPAFGVNPDDNDLHTAEKLSLVIRAMAVAMIENGEAYLLEGVQLHPQLVADLCNEFRGQVCACFVGYAEIDVMTKLWEIRTLDSGNNDWLRHYNDEQLPETIKRLKQLSEIIRNECQAYGLRYFETSTDFEATLGEVMAFLKTARS